MQLKSDHNLGQTESKFKHLNPNKEVIIILSSKLPHAQSSSNKDFEICKLSQEAIIMMALQVYRLQAEIWHDLVHDLSRKLG